MAPDEPTTDAVMRRALSAALPADEPPVGLAVADIMRRGRRRYRVRRAVPLAAAAVVAAVLVAVPLTIGGGGAPPANRPVSTTQPTPTETTTTGPPGPLRPPPGHHRAADADALTDHGVSRLPKENVAAHFGTRSDARGAGNRYGYGLHVLWREDGAYGYLGMLHRTDGDFPASVYGLPEEPCRTPATRLPKFHCVPLDVAGDSTAYSFEIDDGYRVRGVVWDQKDAKGGPDALVTAAFLIPEPGGWTPFRALDDGPRMTHFPLTTAQLADLINMV